MYKSPLVLVLSLVLVAAAAGQPPDQRVEATRKIYADTNSRIDMMRSSPEESSIFAIELVVNKYSASYPAVGIYRRTAAFYYTYGDREKNPYPDTLLKADTVDVRSARVKNSEFYFNDSGELVFVFISDLGAAIKVTRLYFAGGSLIRMIDDRVQIGLRTKRAVDAGAAAKKEAARLAGIFRAALIDKD